MPSIAIFSRNEISLQKFQTMHKPGKAIWYILTCLLFLGPLALYAQDTTKILLEKGDRWDYNKAVRPDAQRIIGNVILRHDSALMYCDSAYLNEAANTVNAYGNVHIHLSDTLNLFGDSLIYNGNTKEARVWSNVKLIDNQTTLTTDTLIYDRKTQIARYDYWGKIVNDKNILISLPPQPQAVKTGPSACCRGLPYTW